MNQIFLILMSVMILSISSAHAFAEITGKDVQIIVRTIDFIEDKPGSKPDIAVVYDPGSDVSVREAWSVASALAQAENKFKVFLVPVGKLNALENVNYAFIVEGLNPHYPKINQALQKYSVLGFTVDRPCVERGPCAVYIDSRDRVEIIVNDTAARAAHIKFKPAFLLMATVI